MLVLTGLLFLDRTEMHTYKDRKHVLCMTLGDSIYSNVLFLSRFYIMTLSYDITVIKWLTACNKIEMTIHILNFAGSTI